MSSTSIEAPARPRPQAAHSTRAGLLCLVVTGITWGTTGASADLVYRASDLGPIGVSFWRHLGGLLLLLAVSALLPRRAGDASPTTAVRRPFRSRAVLLIGSGLAMALFQTAYFAAVSETGVAVATVVCLGSGPILTAVGGRFLLGERIGFGGAAAVAGAIVGLVILVFGDREGLVEPSGIALALLAAAAYAALTLLSRWQGRHGVGESPMSLTMWSFGIAAAVLLPLAWFEGLVPHGDQQWRVAGLMIYLITVATALAYPCYFYGTARVRAATASVMILLEPITAAILAVTLLGERLTATTIAGTLILLSAIVVLALAESRPRRPAAV
jgi:DME family drug/metabolite transporter